MKKFTDRFYRQQGKRREKDRQKSAARKKELADAFKKLEKAKKENPDLKIKTKELKSSQSIKKKVSKEVRKSQKIKRIRTKREKLSRFLDVSFLSDTQVDKVTIKDIDSQNLTAEKYSFLFKKSFDYNRVYHTKKAFIFAYRDYKNENDISNLLKRYDRKSIKELSEMLQWIVNKPLTAIHGKTGTSGGAAGESLIFMCKPEDAETYIKDVMDKNKKGSDAYNVFGNLKKHRQHSDFYSEYQFVRSGGSIAIQDFTARGLLVFACAIMYNTTELDRINFYDSFYGYVCEQIPDMKNILPEPKFIFKKGKSDMRKKKPVKIMTLDTETYNGLIGGLKRIAIYGGSTPIYGFTFKDVESEFLKWYDMGYDVYIYIHNLEFDARKIPEIFDKSRIVWSKCFAINNKLGRIACQKYTFIDSFKILPFSLHKASVDFNVEHGKLDLWTEVKKRYGNQYRDLVDFLDRCDVNDPLYLEYLGYDVMSLYEVIQKLLEVSGLTPAEFVKCNTTASLSRYIFKHGYKGQKFKDETMFRSDYEMLCSYDYTNHMEEEEFARASYCGGRTEVFIPLLEEPGYHYDLNSPYPFVCMTPLPIGKPNYQNNPKIAEDIFNIWMEGHRGFGILSCEIFIPMQDIPPLPCKMGKLTFPCGNVYGTWTFEELEYAIKECGCVIKKYYEVMFYSKTYPIFKRFVEVFSELKIDAEKVGNLALRTFCKLLLNVAYGYTGMRRDDKSRLESIENLENYQSDEILAINSELGYVEIKQEVKSRYIQVIVASAVTSRARLMLLRGLKTVSLTGHAYYCDTDSIVSDVPLDPSMVDPYKIGLFKLESRPERAIFLQPKVYAEIIPMEVDAAEKIIAEGDESHIVWKEDDKFYKVEKKFKGVSKDTQKAFTYYDYQCFLKEFIEKSKKELVVERNKIQLRSIMYMQKKGLDYDTYEVREKHINLQAGQKRNISYTENRTVPHYFKSVEEFEDFNFKFDAIVDFDFTSKGE